MHTYRNGDELREALADGTLRPGMLLMYHGIVHKVIDAGVQGLRIAATRRPE